MSLKTLALVSAAVLSLTPTVGRTPDLQPAPYTIELPSSVLTVTGRIVDATTAQPLAEAAIYVRGTSNRTRSNTAGRFTLQLSDALSGSEITIVARLIGYSEVASALSLTEGTHTLDLSMTPSAVSRLEVVVPAERGPAGRLLEAPASMDVASGGMAQRSVLFSGAAPVDREGYAHISENEWVGVGEEPLSTFSIDVDRASYSNVRRFLRDGMRPPIDAVRIEELVNYFPYSDPAPDQNGEHPFFVSAEVGPAPWQPLHHLVRIGMKAREIDIEDAPANNLVFLLDVSGSMNNADKLPLLKKAFAMLVEELRPEDRVSIVVYAGAAGLVLPSTPGSERETILAALESLRAGGSTAGGAGIHLAYSIAAENFIENGNNRVILATDGDFNVGASSDSEMIRLIEDKRDDGTFLTVLGFGTGNLQDAKMEQIADHGNGNFAYIDSELEARKVLVTEMGGTLLTVAKDVKIQVEFNPAQVAAYRLIGYENRLLDAQDFNDDSKDAGELGAGHTVTALYEIVPVGIETPAEIGTVDPLRYQRDRRTPVADNEELLFVKLRYKEPAGDVSQLLTRKVTDVTHETSDDFRFAAAVAAWGMLLRDSEHCGDFGLADVARMARGGLGEDLEGYRADFLDLLDTARSMDVLEMNPGME